MSLNYPNIVPENNLRLPDALTVKHGPAPLLSRFVLEADKAARHAGIELRLRHDFDALLRLNEFEMSRGNWFRLVNLFNPEYCDLTPENSFWVSGENEDGEIVVTAAWRVFFWPASNLYEEGRLLFYGRGKGRPCEFTPEAARVAERVSGVVLFGGSAWVRPDFRGRQLSHLIPRAGRAYGLARWPVEWAVTIAAPILVEKGVAAGYGYRHVVRSILFPDAPSGHPENALLYLGVDEAYDDLANFLTTELLASEGENTELSSSPNFLDHMVTNTSSEGVFHGSSNRS
jgi:hypothetical protein